MEKINLLTFLTLLLFTLLGSIGSFYFKKMSSDSHRVDRDGSHQHDMGESGEKQNQKGKLSQIWQQQEFRVGTLTLQRSFVEYFILGGFFYGTGAILNIVTLQLLPYTVVYPLTSITYIWTLIISALFLKEKITVKKILGLTLIVAGAFLLVS
ncbi:DMT family transporter [Bacillaceae bacterium S4-13-58]